MSKKIENIYDCICPLCGIKGKIVNKSSYCPEFFCEDCKIWYRYQPKFPVFTKNHYELKEWNSATLCKGHNLAFSKECDELPNECPKCREIRNIKEIAKLKFNKEQLKFLIEIDCDLRGILEKLSKVEKSKIIPPSKDGGF